MYPCNVSGTRTRARWYVLFKTIVSVVYITIRITGMSARSRVCGAVGVRDRSEHILHTYNATRETMQYDSYIRTVLDTIGTISRTRRVSRRRSVFSRFFAPAIKSSVSQSAFNTNAAGHWVLARHFTRNPLKPIRPKCNVHSNYYRILIECAYVWYARPWVPDRFRSRDVYEPRAYISRFGANGTTPRSTVTP